MEYRSPIRLLGVPLVHFATGRLEGGQYRRGIARGWIAIGDIAAIGWIAAVGGLAVAREFALGGAAVGPHANDLAAREFLQQPVGQIAATVSHRVGWLGLLVLLPIIGGLRGGQEEA
jgi:hypothetical protein